MRQLDDIAQVFDPSQKAHFLSHTLHAALPSIPEVGLKNPIFSIFFLKLAQNLKEEGKNEKISESLVHANSAALQRAAVRLGRVIYVAGETAVLHARAL